MIIFSLGLLYASLSSKAQGLQNVIVEEYFINTGASAVAGVPDGAITYRIFLDLQPGYKLINVFGINTPSDPGNDLLFTTTTGFYNEPSFGVTYGDQNNSALFPIFNGTALDSYHSFGGAASGRRGIQKVNDTDGSNLVPFLAGTPPDGYVLGTTPGAAELGVSISGTLEGIQINGADSVYTFDGSFYVLGGTTTTGPDDVIYIGQFTTDGEFSFRFNIQVLDPNGDPELYTHSEILTIDGLDSQITPSLTYPPLPIPGCTEPAACNFNTQATENDGSCILPILNCQACNSDNSGLDIVDDDGDGVCNAEEILGCTDPDALNYNPLATEDNGTCSYEIIEGCTSSTACNYDPQATQNNGTCIEPVEGCHACNADDTGLVLIDSDGDGICDALEIHGCTDTLAINYNPGATDDDGSCLYQAEISLLLFDCGASVLQITHAQQGETEGGVATDETRTIYSFGNDALNQPPSYTGSNWPYVKVPNGYEVVDANVSATLTVNDENILEINGLPAYQFSADLQVNDTNGVGGTWSYFLPDGSPNQNACLTTSARSIFDPVGVLVFPNPTRDALSLKMPSVIGAVDLEIILSDLLGHEIKKWQKDWEPSINLDTSDLPTGIYILNIRHQFESYTQKIVIE